MNTSKNPLFFLTLFVSILSTCPLLAQDSGLSPRDSGLSSRHHPWGKFAPGAWRTARIVTETIDDRGRTIGTNITETKTTLLKIDDDGVALEMESGIEVAGKQFDGAPQCVKQGFHGDPIVPGARAHILPASEVIIEGRTIPCRVDQVESSDANRTTTKVFYSDAVAPFQLRRESVTTDADGKNILSQTSVEVIALDMPYRVLNEIKSTACLKTVQKHLNGTTVTLSLSAADVPGGIIAHTSKETNNEGRVVRRSTLELIGYGFQPEEERSGLFGRKRPPRSRKPSVLNLNPAGR